MASEAMPSLAPGVEDQPEVRDPFILRGPVRPSAEAVDRHTANHLPYRSWCPVCVEARGEEDAHPRRRGEESCTDSLAKVSLDYQELKSKAKGVLNKADKFLKIVVMEDQRPDSVTGDAWKTRHCQRAWRRVDHQAACQRFGGARKT